MARVFTVPESRKQHKCGKCGKDIAVGQPYRWMKPRYGGKRIRCTEFACRFRPTDTSSAKTAQVYEAIEDAESEIGGASDIDDIKSVLSNVADTARSVADEYNKANSTWTQNGASENSEWQEKEEACNEFAYALESWEPDEDISDDANDDERERIIDDARTAAVGALGEFSL